MTTSFIDHPYAAVRREHTLAVDYERFTAAFESLLGVMNLAALGDVAELPADEAHAKLAAFVGPLDFSLFQKIDHGGLLSAFARPRTRAMTYVFGNALIAVEMTKHAPVVGLYVPLRLYVREIGSGATQATYDLPSSMVAQFGSVEASAVAQALDAKVERIISEAAARAGLDVSGSSS